MSKLTRYLLALAVLPGLLTGTALASGGSSDDTPASPPAEQSPEQQAREHYNEGLGYRDQAWRFQKKIDAGKVPDAKLEKSQKKIKNAYDRAIQEFAAATTLDPRHHQAYGSLGYAFRQVGDYASALEAYDRALELAPDYAEAIEYRAEAYLGLNRIDDAKKAYGALMRVEPKLIGELQGAFRAWIGQRRSDPAGVAVGALDDLERWLDERQEGKEVATSSLHKSRSW